MARNPRHMTESGPTDGVQRPKSAATLAESVQRVLTAGLILGCVGVIAVCIPDARGVSGDGVAVAEVDNLTPKRKRAAMARLYDQRTISTVRTRRGR